MGSPPLITTNQLAFRRGALAALAVAVVIATPGFHATTLNVFSSAFQFALFAAICLPVAFTGCLVGISGRTLVEDFPSARQMVSRFVVFSLCYGLAAFATFHAFHPFLGNFLDLLPREQPVQVDGELHYASAPSNWDLTADAVIAFSAVSVWAAGAMILRTLPYSLSPRRLKSGLVAWLIMMPVLLAIALAALVFFLKLLPWLAFGRTLAESEDGRNLSSWIGAAENGLIFAGVTVGLGFCHRGFSASPTKPSNDPTLWRSRLTFALCLSLFIVFAPAVVSGREPDSNFFGLRITADVTVDGETAHIRGGLECKGRWDYGDRYRFDPDNNQEVWFAARTPSGRLVRLSFDPLCYAAYKSRPGELSDGVMFRFRDKRDFMSATSLIVEQKGGYDVRARASNPEDFAKRKLDVVVNNLNVALVPISDLREVSPPTE